MSNGTKTSKDLESVIKVLAEKTKCSDESIDAAQYANAAYFLTKIWAAFLAVEQTQSLNRSYPMKPKAEKDEKAN